MQRPPFKVLESRCDVSELKGKTFISVSQTNNTLPYMEDIITFYISDTEHYTMYHEQSCCESVTIEDICGELEWLVGSPILVAEERVSSDENINGSATWTFYEFATIKGSVTIRWYGTSNGYYSESVDFFRVKIYDCEDEVIFKPDEKTRIWISNNESIAMVPSNIETEYPCLRPRIWVSREEYKQYQKDDSFTKGVLNYE